MGNSNQKDSNPIDFNAKNVLYFGVGSDVYTAFELAPNFENLYLFDTGPHKETILRILESFNTGKYLYYPPDGETIVDVEKVAVKYIKKISNKKTEMVLDIIYADKPRKIYFYDEEYWANIRSEEKGKLVKTWPKEVKDLDVIITIGFSFSVVEEDLGIDEKTAKKILEHLYKMLSERTRKIFRYYRKVYSYEEWDEKQKEKYKEPFKTRFHNKISYIICDKSSEHKFNECMQIILLEN